MLGTHSFAVRAVPINSATSPSTAATTTTPATPQDPTKALPSLLDLRKRLETLEQRLAGGKAPADPQNLALFRFKLEQARMLLGIIDRDEAISPVVAQRALAADIERASVVSHALGDAVFPAPSQTHERAYIAPDGSVQPYWVFVPKNYDARKAYPLAIFLHGYDPYISKIEPWIPGDKTWSIATDRGFILAIPYGRRNSDFVDIGEDDTLTVTNAVKAHYHVDNSRVYMMGASMGGYGAYAVALHHPDIWAATAVMSGRTDFYLWFKLNRDEVPFWKRLQYDADDPRHLKYNALYLPFYIQHGALDTIVDPEHSRRFYDDLKALHYAVRYREIADADHYLYWQDLPYETAFDWASKLRHVATPRRVIYTTGCLHDNHAYWAEINSFADYSRLAQIEAQVQPGNKIEVKTDNVTGFTLTPPASILEPNHQITLQVNGSTLPTPFDPTKPVQWSAVPQATNTTTPIKTPQRCGPIKLCYRDAFLLVYGTLQAPKTRPQPVKTQADATTNTGAQSNVPSNGINDTNPFPTGIEEFPTTGNPDEDSARRFSREWDRYADGVPPIKADKDVTEDDRKRYNLILFGTRQSNTILAQIADQLPVELTATGYRLGEKQYTVQRPNNLGVQLCYPSPFSQERMVVVQSGVFWGNSLPINHKFDLLPDYIVYDSSVDPSDSSNRAVTAGYFDGNWKLTANAGPEPATLTSPTFPGATGDENTVANGTTGPPRD